MSRYQGHNDPMQWAGWTTRWDAGDREEVQAHHRTLYRALKEEHGGIRTSPDEIPGLLEGVESLLEYGYSLVDIGAMVGVTRERVRQWVEEYGLNRPYDNGAQYRIWDDDLHRFVPVEHEDMKVQARLAYQERRERERRHELALRWNRAVTACRDMSAELGYAPTLWEVARRVFPDRDLTPNSCMASLCSWLDPQMLTDDGRTYTDVTGLLYRIAGLPAPQVGAPGHRPNRPQVAS